MKTFLLPLATAASLSLSLLHGADSAGYFDLGQFTPPKSGGTFVEVNLKGNLLSMAAKIAAKEEPEAAELIRSIESIRVNVIGLDDANRAEIKGRVDAVRTGLNAAGWERVVTVQEDGNDVGVYTKTKDADSISGVVVTVLSQDGEAVFVNVVGDIKPERLAELGEHLHLDPLKAVKKAAKEDAAETKK